MISKDISLSGHQHHRTLKLVPLAFVTLLLGGCTFGVSGLTKTSTSAPIITSSVTQPVKSAGVANEDAEIIKDTVVTANLKPVSSTLAWANPNTGSSGTIVAIENFLGKHGQQCRGFKTTVSTFMGIAFYNGEACQISPGQWVLSWFRKQDSRS